MMILSSRWPSLLCMAIVFLGWLSPITGAVETKDIYKVLTKADGMGGDCDALLPQVNAMAGEVKALVDASINAIELILRDPNSAEKKNKNNEGSNRERILLLARQIFGAEFGTKSSKIPGVNSDFLKLDAASKGVMNTVNKNFKQIQDYINKGGDHKWRFSCGDSWVRKVDTLQTNYSPLQKGTPIIEVGGLNGGYGNQAFYDYTWFDRGGPKMNPEPPEKPNESAQEERARFNIQNSWYYIANKGWSEQGPCSGIRRTNKGPEAETMNSKRIIYFCQKVWDNVTQNKWKADLTTVPKGNIPTDGSAHLDNYQSPGATLLHEMTHHLFDTNDDLGYDWENVQTGRHKRGAAVTNADSYNYFAAAAYLSNYEWHSGVARTIGTKETCGAKKK